MLYAIANELVKTPAAKPLEARHSAGEETWSGVVSDDGLKPVAVPQVYLPASQASSSPAFSKGGKNYVPLRPGTDSGRKPARGGVGLDIDLANPLLGSPSTGVETEAAPLRAETPVKVGANINASAASGWLEFDIGELGGNPGEEKKR